MIQIIYFIFCPADVLKLFSQNENTTFSGGEAVAWKARGILI
jgi:hypothetical protein